jgi:hypothetical protein
MKIEKTRKYLEVLMAKCFDSGLSDMWLATHYDAEDRNIEDVIEFDDRKEIFFSAICANLNTKLGPVKIGASNTFPVLPHLNISVPFGI